MNVGLNLPRLKVKSSTFSRLEKKLKACLQSKNQSWGSTKIFPVDVKLSCCLLSVRFLSAASAFSWNAVITDETTALQADTNKQERKVKNLQMKNKNT